MEDTGLPDLRLFAALEVLITERHVSRAAERFGVSQPAMSALLARLRRLFGDPLLVRTREGMVPTGRGLRLAGEAAAIVERARRLGTDHAGFEPAKVSRVFRLVATDYVLMLVMPAIQAALEKEAPGLAIEARPPNPRRLLDMLASGQVDLGIGYLADPPQGLRRRLLFRERSVCIARKHHPTVRGRLTLSQYREAPHVRISPGGAGHYARLVEAALVGLHIHRQGGVTVPNFLVAPAIVSRSDLLATVPARVAEMYRRPLELQVLEPPVPLPPLDVSLYWHEAAQRDPLHRWMRDLVLRVMAGEYPADRTDGGPSLARR